MYFQPRAESGPFSNNIPLQDIRELGSWAAVARGDARTRVVAEDHIEVVEVTLVRILLVSSARATSTNSRGADNQSGAGACPPASAAPGYRFPVGGGGRHTERRSSRR